MSQRSETDAIIIGGGISGLSLAHALLAQGRAVTVLEREARVGGALHSIRPAEGFWLELGGHTGYNSYGRLLAIVEQLGLRDALLRRETSRWMLWHGGRAVSVPSRLRWLELARSLPWLLAGRGEEETVADYYGRVLGRRNFEQVLRPMFSAVVSQDAAQIPAALLFKKRPRRKDLPRSFAFAGGLQSIAEAIAAQPGLSMRAGTGAAAVARAGAAWRVTMPDGSVLEAPVLALTTAPDAAAALLAHAAPEAAAALGALEVATLETEGVVLRAEQVKLAPMAGLVGVEAPFRSVVTRDTVGHAQFRGFAFHFRPESPPAERAAQMAAVLGCAPEHFEHRITVRRTLPSPRPGHAARIARLDAALAGQHLLVTGNFFGGLAIEDCVGRSAAEAERLAAQR